MADTKTVVLPVATFEDIVAAKDMGDVETVAVPEWKASVRVRGLSRGEVLSGRQDGVNYEAYLLSVGMVEPAVTIEQATDIVNGKSFQALERILDRIVDLSGLGAGFRAGQAGAAGS